jgi:hypothetical protein
LESTVDLRFLASLLGLFLAVAPAVADDHIVQFDTRFDFSKVRTFAIRDGRLRSAREELNNALVAQNLKEAIRAQLIARGLKESATAADLFVEFSVSSDDYSIGSGGRANRIPTERRGRRGTAGAGPPDFSEAALVIDLVAPQQPELLVWRGVYRDTEKNISKMVEKLSDDTRKLISDYPPKAER